MESINNLIIERARFFAQANSAVDKTARDLLSNAAYGITSL
ncbi:hypothetical protein [Thalassolituus oleivorans]|nr:hypothetical protein [Thalassolituus oleivorans]